MPTPILELSAVGFPGPGGPLFAEPLTMHPGELLYAEGDYLCGAARLLDHLWGCPPERPRHDPPGRARRLSGRPRPPAPSAPIDASGRRRVLGRLTVAEHLQLRALNWPEPIAIGPALKEARVLFPVLRELPDIPCGNFSGGQQQMVMLAVAAVCRPRVLVLDEPCLGLAPEVRPLVAAGAQACSAGVGDRPGRHGAAWVERPRRRRHPEAPVPPGGERRELVVGPPDRADYNRPSRSRDRPGRLGLGLVRPSSWPPSGNESATSHRAQSSRGKE